MNNALFSLIRPHYQTLQGYVSAGMEAGKDESKIYMNANENPFELPGLEGFNRYPEPQPPALLEGYAGLYGVQPEHIAATRGADEAIVVLTKLFCEPHQDAVLVTPPTFGMYGVDARAMPADVVEIPLVKDRGTFRLDKDAMIAAGQDNTRHIKLVYICSPNNPTGNDFDHTDILEITSALKGHAVVILDETYAEFSSAGSLSGELGNQPNLVILRTLSKSFSMAGMRMGCLLAGDPEFIALVRSKGLDAYPLPRASIAAALKVMDPAIQKTARENITRLLAEKERLAAGFAANALVRHIYPSDANFFLMEMEGAHAFWQYCHEHNLILRDFSDKALTENCLRISTGTPEENDRLLTLLSSFSTARKDSAA